MSIPAWSAMVSTPSRIFIPRTARMRRRPAEARFIHGDRKDLIDELNADHTRGALASSEFTATNLSMHFYDSMVFFERGRHQTKHAPMMGGTPEVPRGSRIEG